jgi:hypothetical protein
MCCVCRGYNDLWRDSCKNCGNNRCVTLGDLPAAGAQPSAGLWNWAWLSQHGSDVGTRLEELSLAHGWDVNAIAAVIKIESGGNPAAVNKLSGATGLIQFMPETAKSLGTTVEALRSMSALGQLDFVERYLERALGGVVPSDPGDYYIAVFMPAYIGRADSDVIATKGGKVYDQNAGLDADKNGVLSVGDIRSVFHKTYDSAAARGSWVPGLPQVPQGTSHLTQGQGVGLAAGLLLVVGWIFVRTLRHV